MKRIQIRDIGVIEKELNNNYIGMISFLKKEEVITQVPVTFIYFDKNIYFFFREDDDTLSNIPFGSLIKFIIFKNNKVKSDPVLYKILNVSVAGSIKFVDDPKQIEELRKSYNKKYKVEDDEPLKIFMINTEEFLAFEYTGE